MKMFQNLLLVFIFTLGFAISNAQTNVSGSITSNALWTVSGSPYIVTGNVVLFDGFTLVVMPGVSVKFNTGASLEVRGKIYAVGTQADTITFTSNEISPAPGSWAGFRVIGTTNPLGVGDQITMEYCKGMYANRFIDLDLAYHGPYVFRHCLFSRNNQTNYDGGMPITSFEHCKFSFNGTALVQTQFFSRVSNSYFVNNTIGVNGINTVDTCYFSGHSQVALSPYGSASGCTVENNNIGVNCFFNGANDTFINNRIQNNVTGIEMLTYFNGSIVFTGNTICNNTSYNIRLLHVNNADLSNNCWCTTDSLQIRAKIYDGYVNTAYGLVNFMPLAGNCPVINVGIVENSFDDIQLYPNPTRDLIYLKLPEGIAAGKIDLYSTMGNWVRSFPLIGGVNEIDLESLAVGLYFLQVNSEMKITRRKFIKIN